MLRFTPLSHAAIATGLVLGLAATSTLTVSVTPAGAVPSATGSPSAAAVVQNLAVGASADVSVFGVTRDHSGVSLAPTVVWPVQEHTVSDGFGHREAPTAGASTEHPGVDFAAHYGATVSAAAAGVVRKVVAADHGGCGVNVTIDHAVRGQNVSTVYCHLATGSVRVAPGDRVIAGEAIAAVGSTGVSTGAHLHFEVRPNGGAPIDPLPWLAALSA